MDYVSGLVQTFLIEHHKELEHQLMSSDGMPENIFKVGYPFRAWPAPSPTAILHFPEQHIFG